MYLFSFISALNIYLELKPHLPFLFICFEIYIKPHKYPKFNIS